MFTGIIEEKGKIIEIKKKEDKLQIKVEAGLSQYLQEGASIAVDGICLTVIKAANKYFLTEAIKPTIDITTLKWAKINQYVNLERALTLQKEIGGHFVLGHIDGIAELIYVERGQFFHIHKYRLENKDKKYLIPKGSICINGVSLTISEIGDKFFSVNLIPYTLEKTNLGNLKIGNYVNIEFDIIGKYIYNFIREIKRNNKSKEKKLKAFLKEI